jgi:hypothetical protein
MTAHKLKAKKRAAGKQWWADLAVDIAARTGHTPVGHHAEDRKHGCGDCGHHWSWHDNVWLRAGEAVGTRCTGAYFTGMTAVACPCKEVYPGDPREEH